jgi:hypothetical protein
MVLIAITSEKKDEQRMTGHHQQKLDEKVK